MKKPVVLLSGGLDSATLLHSCAAEDPNVHALSILYGQRHVREIDAARAIAKRLDVRFTVCDLEHALRPIFAGATSSQVGIHVPVPFGHYADESMKLTIVPNRNAVLLSVAAALAVSLGLNTVAYAAHAGDHPIYPDCRPAFIDALSIALELGCGVSIYAPFASITKTDIVKQGAKLGVPFDLTYSCYVGGPFHCGRCGTCTERREAFRDAGVEDPTQYADLV